MRADVKKSRKGKGAFGGGLGLQAISILSNNVRQAAIHKAPPNSFPYKVPPIEDISPGL